MSAPAIPVHWILEYAVKHPANFKEEFIERRFYSFDGLILRITRQYRFGPRTATPTPIVIVALLKRIFSIPSSLKACDPDMCVHETIEYLELLEKQRTKRIKALERRSIGAEFIKTSPSVYARYIFALTGVKYWVCSHPFRC